VTPYSIDQIEISDQFIEVRYWVNQQKNAQSVLFRVPEFEHWLSQVRSVSWPTYWDNWQPLNPRGYAHRIIGGDIQRFFEYKMSMMGLGEGINFSQHQRPMHRVGNTDESNSKSQTA